jgi:CheY-like chemotaxis protein
VQSALVGGMRGCRRPVAGTGGTRLEVVRGEIGVPQDVPPKRILLVDDYPDALEIWGLYLRSVGYDVRTADDGLKAVEEAHQYHPDIIVLDLELPGLTGFEVAVHLRQCDDTSSIPLIAATGYSHAKQLDHARHSGFDSVVVKPCEPAALVAEIERLLDGGRQRKSPSVGAAVERVRQNR